MFRDADNLGINNINWDNKHQHADFTYSQYSSDWSFGELLASTEPQDESILKTNRSYNTYKLLSPSLGLCFLFCLSL